MNALSLSMLSLACVLTGVRGGELPDNINGCSEETHVFLAISNGQLNEIETLRRVTLDRTQLAKLRAVAPDFPKRIGVASPFVDRIGNSRFCLWPNQITAVWCSQNIIAIPKDSPVGGRGWREFSRTLDAGDAILIDTHGHYSVGSKSINREKLTSELAKLGRKEPVGKQFEIFILRPPLLEDPQSEKAVEQSIKDLTGLCEEHGIDVRVGG